MYTIAKTFTIAGAHYLPEHPGKCRELHGHNWKITVICQQSTLSNEGIVLDFGGIKNYIKSKLDHKLLNDIIENPTAERLAKWIADELGSQCTMVIVEESEGSLACYTT